MRRLYVAKEFRGESLQLVMQMNAIIDDYRRQGYVLTIRQLYYQLVASDVIPNTIRSYERVARIANDARLAGMMDWDAIEDRTRDFITRAHWESGKEILKGCADSFHMDLWAYQESRVFVVIEKEALVGILARTCRDFDVPLLAARGYPSVSVLYDFVQNHLAPNSDKYLHILHLGDHDPSGIDMSRDLEERLRLLESPEFEFHRLALNMDQIKKQKPPPNPAKNTDSRFASYKRQFGTESWELDALKPNYLTALVSRAIQDYIDVNGWDARREEITEIRTKLHAIAETF